MSTAGLDDADVDEVVVFTPNSCVGRLAGDHGDVEERAALSALAVEVLPAEVEQLTGGVVEHEILRVEAQRDAGLMLWSSG